MRDNFKQWLKERDEAVLSFDVEKFKKFYRKWTKLGVYNVPMPSDRIIEIALRKGVCAMLNPPPDKLDEAKRWLDERGYTYTIGGGIQ